MHSAGPIAPAAAVCSWREMSLSNRWPWEHSIHGVEYVIPPTSATAGPFGGPKEPVKNRELCTWWCGQRLRSTLVSKAPTDHFMRRAGGAVVFGLLSAGLIRSDQVIARSGSIRSEGRMMTTAQASTGQIRQQTGVVFPCLPWPLQSGPGLCPQKLGDSGDLERRRSR